MAPLSAHSTRGALRRRRLRRRRRRYLDWRLNGTKRSTIQRSTVPAFDDDLLSISVSTFQAFLTSGLSLKSLEQEDWCWSNLGLLNVASQPASQSERSTINANWCCSFSFLGRMSATIYATVPWHFGRHFGAMTQPVLTPAKLA